MYLYLHVLIYPSIHLSIYISIYLSIYLSIFLFFDIFFHYRDLAPKDVSGKSDPYAVIYYRGKELSTPVLRKTRFPRWNKTYEIPIKKPIADPSNRTLRISLYDWDKFHHDKFQGEVYTISVSEIQYC